MADTDSIQVTPEVDRPPRLIPWIAWLAAAALIVLGALCIGAYVSAVAEVWNSHDRSAIYWLLFLPAFGITLIGAGGYFAVVGFLARRGNPLGAALARYSLVALAALVGLVLLTGYVQEQRWAQDRRERMQVENLHDDRQHHARKIERIDLDVMDSRQLVIRADLADGLDGSYRWTLTLSDFQAVLHEESRLLQLQGPTDPIIRELPFDAVFADCFAPGHASPASVCVKGGGVEDIYTVAVRLELIEDARGAVSAYELRHAPIASTAAADVEIDTMTTQHEVIVKQARIL